MKQEEFRKIRESLGLTQEQLASELEIELMDIIEIEEEEGIIIEKHIEYAMRYLAKNGIPCGMPCGKPELLMVRAGGIYWEDATIDGIADTQGLMPFRKRNSWEPVIELASGKVLDWPQGKTAKIHYKVCDSGEYWLADKERRKFLKWKDDYVPNEFLCHGDEGYGDYIILSIGPDGKIKCWEAPKIYPDQWEACDGKEEE